ncbi:long-chain fatty acid--CoA ligase [Streptomyces piniterrae]|uniref:Acyl-CoA synthetase n=1 Tax=Streptomyces piniterrae TaxID=2571125 RepID=A0A4U0MTY2_9ACTN|nr:long-chain fatty acid--CoA ligase [Streptomyces piniterrae]TJZ44447.1 long-chain fatty acid--CoA ligase [Streptomyces piniterrae]
MHNRPDTLAVFTEWTAERFHDLPALRFREGEGWGDRTYGQLRDAVRAVGRGLIGGLGVRAGDRVAILSETRPEWTYAHFGVLATGAAVVPVYPTAGDGELAWVLADSGACAVICEGREQAARVARIRSELPALRHIALLTETGNGAEQADGAGDGYLALDALPSPAALPELRARSAAVTGADLAAIVYTSGTTGPPKGCRLTHGNFAAVQDSTAHLIAGGPGDVTYLYLPLAHLLAQLIELKALLLGGTLCYFGGKIENVVAELAEARPTHLPSVPRLFEKVYATVRSLAESQEGGLDRFEAAVRTGVEVAELRDRGEEPGGELLERWRAADGTLFSLVRAAFGGRLRWALTGAAPIAPQTLDFLRACGIAVHEGYGMTESAGVISLNHPGAVRYGTVGRPVAGCEVRIAEDGEVLARGTNIFAGYHANPAADAEALDADGWLHTGDLGALDADGFLSITGRKKELIITSSGKNLTPSTVEFAIQQSRYVSRAVMIGDRRPYPVALITLDPEEIATWAARTGTRLGDVPARHPAVRALVQEAVDAANERAARPARIRAFAILAEDLAVESGELTPTLKVRRAAVAERYAKEIEALYSS